MAGIALSVHGLGKMYRLGGGARSPEDLRDHLTDWLRSGLSRTRTDESRDFWALRDVSFDLRQGEIIGIVGSNGAGKSTLLKILSRITEPTEGEARVFGRVGSLLEVGVGFHPELSGRENVYLNGAILGMSRAEIRAKFDEIVAFSGVERFLDTPVKRYSSGMYVRLAFAVVAHLEHDILMVDEVLAVGDAAFQRKCLGKMESITRESRSVLLVSHNMDAIARLCSTVIWLAGGRLVTIGTPSEVIASYLSEGVQSSCSWTPVEGTNAAFRYHSVSVSRDDTGQPAQSVPADVPISVLFDFTPTSGLPPGRLALKLSNEVGQTVLSSASTDRDSTLNRAWRMGRQRMRCVIPAGLLAPGRYFLTVSEPLDQGDRIHEGVLSFSVSEQNSIVARDGRSGVIAPILAWEIT